ncbi:hypothetical protein [Parasphingorhabdus sp.]|uniref:hypothetical protein n=1 Tax=Parasphingorhabdus sp. TaxID=2709688 RepID=UPI003A93C4F8
MDDQEHGSISVIHESEWCLGISSGGYVCFENVESDDEPKHMRDVSREKLICLMQSLALGNIGELEKEPWLSGY